MQTQDKCGLGRLRLATDGPGPGERQRRRGGALGSGNSAFWQLHRDTVTRGPSSLWSSPPRLFCRSPGPGPSVASLSRPEPHLSRVYKLTLTHNYPHTGPHTPITDHRRAGTHSHFTHAQTQPHQSTALLRVVMDRPLGAVEAPQLLLLSAPFSACRAPHDSAARESSSVLPVEYSSLSREFRAAGSGSQLHTR